MRSLITDSHVILMKVGPYCGFELDEIIDIKKKEQARVNKFFWGYGGVFCRPKTIYSFVIHAKLNKSNLKVYFTTTKSAFISDSSHRFSKFSVDKNIWEELPKEVLLVGNANSDHFAIVAKNLKEVDKKINLSDYCTFKGALPDPNKLLDSYYQYRVDKACGYYLPGDNRNQKYKSVDYECELVEPYCVFIK